MEDDFQDAKEICHLDEGQVTCWNSWARYGPWSFRRPDETATTCCGGPPGAAAINTAPAAATAVGTRAVDGGRILK